MKVSIMTNVENVEVRDQKTNFAEIDEIDTDTRKYWQVDLLKVFAMVLVIMDHSIPHSDLYELASPFWQRIAIPLFLIILEN